MDNLINRYYTFSGRLNRLKYLRLYLELTILNILITWLIGKVLAIFGMNGGFLYSLITCMFSFFVTLCSIGLTSRRLHDTGHTGWWQMVMIIPSFMALIGTIFIIIAAAGQSLQMDGSMSLIALGSGIIAFSFISLALLICFVFQCYLWFKKGTEGDNKYGPDPLAPEKKEYVYVNPKQEEPQDVEFKEDKSNK